MWLRQFLFIAAISCSPLAVAQSDDVCTNLAQFSCAPGKYNDGTGSAQNPTTTDNPIENLKKQAALDAQKRFRDALADPSNSYFRKLVLGQSGLSSSPGCENAAQKPSDSCLKRMAESAADLAIRNMSNSEDPADLFNPPPISESLQVLTNSTTFQNVSKATLDDMKKSMGADKTDKKIRDTIFPRVKELIISKIERMISSPEVRNNLIDKIKAIQYSGGDCSSLTGGKENIDNDLIPNAYYNPRTNQFSYCSGMNAVNNSEFQMVETIAHELSHSFDPCGITLGPQGYSFQYKSKDPIEQQNEFPIQGILGCLKSQMRLDGQVATNRRASGRNVACANGNARKLNEAFADWMSAEVLPDYMQKYDSGLTRDQNRIGYSNTFRGTCNPNSGGINHPTDQLRLDNIILVQPKIREQMGCSPNLPEGRQYCVYGTSSTATSPSNGNNDSQMPGAVR